jgi:hypothetical protein
MYLLPIFRPDLRSNQQRLVLKVQQMMRGHQRDACIVAKYPDSSLIY